MQTEKNLYKFAKDTGISADDIKPELRDISYTIALQEKSVVEQGDYISIANRNNLAEMLVYCRTPFRESDDTVMEWDGFSKDRTWYDENPGANMYLISNPNQLAALSDIVLEGETFEGKTVRLASNINLNKKKWTPIGEHKVPFRGMFDGDGHGIYNLHVTWDEIDESVDINDMSRWIAFFSKLEEAVIKNLTFEGVEICDTRETRGGAAVVTVQANDTIFTNINISGNITGNICAAIAVQAVDSTFYNCINRAAISGKTFCKGDSIIVGGFTAVLKVSERMVEIAAGHDIKIFEKCYQEGTITTVINHDADLVAVGQLYGLFYENEVNVVSDKQIGIIIDRCITSQTILETVDGTNVGRKGYFAKTQSQMFGTNYVDPVAYKSDMMDGVIGRTPISVGVTILKATMSNTVNKMVIPGSLNTLRSRPYIRNFTTENSSPIDVADGIISLAPYYSFVKSVSI